MLSNIAKIIGKNEQVQFSLSQKEDGSFALVLTLKMNTIELPATYKEEKEIKEKIEKARTILAKPIVITGTVEEIESQVSELVNSGLPQTVQDVKQFIQEQAEALEALKASTKKNKTSSKVKVTTETKTTKKTEAKATDGNKSKPANTDTKAQADGDKPEDKKEETKEPEMADLFA